MIKVNIEGKYFTFPKGISLEKILKEVDLYDKRIVVNAIVNNRLSDLTDTIGRKFWD